MHDRGQYSHPNNHTLSIVDDMVPKECDELLVACTNQNQWRVVRDPYGCIVPYCMDGYCKFVALFYF